LAEVAKSLLQPPQERLKPMLIKSPPLRNSYQPLIYARTKTAGLLL
jgi:hypothetical protein